MDGYLFGVTGDGCGCVSMNVSGNSTSVTCSGWTTAGQTCFFEVRTLSQDCGLASNPVSSAIRLSGLYILCSIILSNNMHDMMLIFLKCHQPPTTWWSSLYIKSVERFKK